MVVSCEWCGWKGARDKAGQDEGDRPLLAASLAAAEGQEDDASIHASHQGLRTACMVRSTCSLQTHARSRALGNKLVLGAGVKWG